MKMILRLRSLWLIAQSFRVTVGVGALVLILSVVWITMLFLAGGVSQLNPGFLLIPIVIAAFYFGPLIGGCFALAVGYFIGPWMDGWLEIAQPFADWGIRAAVYGTVGVLVGILSARLHTQNQRKIEENRALLDATPELIGRERIKALRDMASGVVHDLNNALASIVGYTDLLLRSSGGREGDSVVRYAEAIKQSSESASTVVKRLRAFYDEEHAKPRLYTVNLRRIVEQSIAMTEARWRAQARTSDAEIHPRVNCPDDLVIIGNENELCGLFGNLIFNAVDAMPEGGTLAFEGKVEDDTVLIHVSDTGSGMSPELQSSCLKPYVTTKASGTGLGMSIAASIMRYHGGTISAQSEVGRGTRITLAFPVPAFEKVQALEEPESAPRISPFRILVADDDTLVREMLAEILVTDGHTVTVATDGRNGLQAFHKDPDGFDLLLVDLAMPRMSGYAMIREIKKSHPRTPLILLSGFDSIREADSGPHTGPIISLTKPVTIAELRRALYEISRTVA